MPMISQLNIQLDLTQSVIDDVNIRDNYLIISDTFRKDTLNLKERPKNITFA